MADTGQVSSVINAGLPAYVPELYKQNETIALYTLLVQSITNLVSQMEQYSGLSQKAMAQWSLLTPTDTLRRQNLGRLYVVAGENIAYGAFVNLYNNAGTLTARNSDSSAGKSAFGYCNVNNSQQVGMDTGDFGEVILGQGIIGVTGIVPGDLVYLSATPGQVQVGPDLTVGHIEQFIGLGIATDKVYVDITMGSWIQH